MSKLYGAPQDKTSSSLTMIILAVSIVTFAFFGGLYFMSLNSGEMITAPSPVDQFAAPAPPAWVPPEERVSPANAAKSPAVQTGQF